MISKYPIFTGFRGLTGCQRDPRDRVVTIIELDLTRGPGLKLSLCNLSICSLFVYILIHNCILMHRFISLSK